MITESILTCLSCSHKEQEELYENVSPSNFKCKNCEQTMSITKGDCCIYCTFGDIPCLNAQIEGSACCSG